MTTPTPAPLVTVDELAEMWRPLSGAEKEFAERVLLPAASAWVREKKPDLDDDDPRGRLVVVEMVKTVLLPGQWAGYSQWSKTVGARTVAATLADPRASLIIAPNHLDMLGIGAAHEPKWSFARGDWDV